MFRPTNNSLPLGALLGTLAVLSISSPIAHAGEPPASCASLASSATIEGTNGRDVIQGTPGMDVIFAKAGNDVIRGRGGNDKVCAGAGNDKVTTLDGFVQVNGGSGDDKLTTGTGSNSISPGPGDDYINARGFDTAFSLDYLNYSFGAVSVTVDLRRGRATGEGTDTFVGVTGVEGSQAVDVLRGSDGNDFLSGNGGDDTIKGRGGNDQLNGGLGDDTVFGDDGDDYLFGGGDPDGGLGDFGFGGAGTDQCEAFETATDCESR